MAAFANSAPATRFLLSPSNKSAPPDTSDFVNSLVISCRAGFHQVAKLLLRDTRVDPSLDKNASITATMEGHPSIVGLLLQHPRFSPAVAGNSCIGLACQYGRLRIVNLILGDTRVDWKANNFRDLRIADHFFHEEIVTALLDNFVAHPGRDMEGEEPGEEVGLQLNDPEVVKRHLQEGGITLEARNFAVLRRAHQLSYRATVTVMLDFFLAKYPTRH